MRALVLLPILLIACGGGSAVCGEELSIGPDASPLVPYCSGDTITIEAGGGGFGFALAFEMTGIDGTTSTIAVMRATFEGEPSQDAFGGVVLNDRGDGLFATNTFFLLNESTDAEVAALDGVPMVFSTAMTDGNDVTIETILDLVAAAP